LADNTPNFIEPGLPQRVIKKILIYGEAFNLNAKNPYGKVRMMRKII